jgi:hypothetical protein
VNGIRCEVLGCRGNTPCPACLMGLSSAIGRGIDRIVGGTDRRPDPGIKKWCMDYMREELDSYWARAVSSSLDKLSSVFQFEHDGKVLFINTQNGSDSGKGSREEPLRTWAEVKRRMGLSDSVKMNVKAGFSKKPIFEPERTQVRRKQKRKGKK